MSFFTRDTSPYPLLLITYAQLKTKQTKKMIFLRMIFAFFIFSSVHLIYTAWYHGWKQLPENQCSMTYQRPEFHLIPVNSSANVPAELYLYHEQRTRPQKLEKTIPVIFIPGNRGSFQQVRSLASVTLRQSQSLSFFSVDFFSPFTAVYGDIKIEQSVFINDAAQVVRNLTGSAPILVGHSVGGIVARYTPLLDNYIDGSIHSIVTLSSPHRAPVANIDAGVHDFYTSFHQGWNQLNHAHRIPLVAFSGGIRDHLVESSYTLIESGVSTPHLSIHSTEVVGTWLSLDHLCILWCNEFAYAFSKTLILLSQLPISSTNTTEPMDLNHIRKHLTGGWTHFFNPDSIISTVLLPSMIRKSNPSSPLELTTHSYHMMHLHNQTEHISFVIPENSRKDFVIIASHQPSTLECKLSLTRKLSSSHNESLFEVLPHFFPVPEFLNREMIFMAKIHANELPQDTSSQLMISVGPTKTNIISDSKPWLMMQWSDDGDLHDSAHTIELSDYLFQPLTLPLSNSMVSYYNFTDSGLPFGLVFELEIQESSCKADSQNHTSLFSAFGIHYGSHLGPYQSVFFPLSGSYSNGAYLAVPNYHAHQSDNSVAFFHDPSCNAELTLSLHVYATLGLWLRESLPTLGASIFITAISMRLVLLIYTHILHSHDSLGQFSFLKCTLFTAIALLAILRVGVFLDPEWLWLQAPFLAPHVPVSIILFNAIPILGVFVAASVFCLSIPGVFIGRIILLFRKRPCQNQITSDDAPKNSENNQSSSNSSSKVETDRSKHIFFSPSISKFLWFIFYVLVLIPWVFHPYLVAPVSFFLLVFSGLFTAISYSSQREPNPADAGLYMRQLFDRLSLVVLYFCSVTSPGSTGVAWLYQLYLTPNDTKLLFATFYSYALKVPNDFYVLPLQMLPCLLCDIYAGRLFQLGWNIGQKKSLCISSQISSAALPSTFAPRKGFSFTPTLGFFCTLYLGSMYFVVMFCSMEAYQIVYPTCIIAFFELVFLPKY